MSRKVRKRRRRKKGLGIVLKIFCVIIAIFAIFAAMTVFFKINEITVTGTSPYTSEEIIAASGITIGENTFFVNKFSAIAKIFQKCRYLDEISMKRHLPDKLEIIVKESVAVGVVNSGTNGYLVDKKGRILEYATVKNVTGLIEIRGVGIDGGTSVDTAQYTEKEKEKVLINILNELINYDIIDKIRKIDLEKIYSVTMQYEDRLQIVLGSGEELGSKLKFLQAVIDELQPGDTGVIDISDYKKAVFRPQTK